MGRVQQEIGLGGRTVDISENAISVTIPFFWLKGVVATAIYVLLVGIIVLEGPGTFLTPSYLIAILVFTLVWVWYMARQRVVTVFDAFAKKVYRRNMLYCMKEVDFADIAEIARVHETGMGNDVYFYRIALKENRLGKGLALTDTYREDDAALAYFSGVALPAIENMLGKAVGAGAGGEAVSLENVRSYVRVGERYVRTRRWSRVGILLAGIALVVIGIVNGGRGYGVIGGMAVVYSFIMIYTVILDTGSREIVVGRAFGLWKKVYPMARFAGIETVRSHTNGIYGGTTARVTFENPGASFPLAYYYFTGRLSVLVDETTAIIVSAMGDGGDAKTAE